MSVREAEATIDIFGANGSFMRIAGEGQGEQGAQLATDMKGFYDAPVKTFRREGAHQIGGNYLGKKYTIRDVAFGLHVHGNETEWWESRDSAVRKAFSYELDPWNPDAQLARMQITTEISGARSLRLALSESIGFESEFDPLLMQRGVTPVLAAAMQPMWFEDDFLGTPEHPAHWELTSGTSGEGSVWISNPTDQPMAHSWICSGTGTFGLPDFSWTGPEYARVPGVDFKTGRDDSERMYTVPTITSADGGGATVHVSRMKIPVRSFSNTNIAGRTNGKRLLYAVPPYTPPTEVPVYVTGASPGAGVQLRMPRLWSRPWGLE